MKELKPEQFKVFGLQTTSEGNYLVSMLIENGEIKDILTLEGPDGKAVAMERLRLAVSKMMLELSNG